MKITPDSSLFTALSNLPSKADAAKRAVHNPQAREEQLQGKLSGSSKEDLIRRALADGNLRQQAVKRAQDKQAVARSAAAEATPRGSVTREVPFAASEATTGTQPQFKRLGQIVDIRI